jgi:hypothetical protein
VNVAGDGDRRGDGLDVTLLDEDLAHASTEELGIALVARLFDFYLRLMLLSALNTRPSSFDLSALRCTAYNTIRPVIATSLG